MQEISGLSEQIERIVFMGFMGAGKSTVGGLVARRLGWHFVDADHHLQAKTGLSIAELFALHGEPGFRRMEAQAVNEVLREGRLVLALGGGAVETESTQALLTSAPATCLVFLDAPLSTLILRCEQQSGGDVRPVLDDREQLEARWRNRLPLYRRAHLTVNTAGLTPDRVVDQILESLSDRLRGTSNSVNNATGKEISR
jgi:shikimate kinase